MLADADIAATFGAYGGRRAALIVVATRAFEQPTVPAVTPDVPTDRHSLELVDQKQSDPHPRTQTDRRTEEDADLVQEAADSHAKDQ